MVGVCNNIKKLGTFMKLKLQREMREKRHLNYF